MSNAFQWQGKPSIFTTGKGQQDFTGANHGRSLEMSARNRPPPVLLDGSLPYQRPIPLDLRSRKKREEDANG
jgi:hypothetical protein